MSHTSVKTLARHLDRTPLLIGIVIIPLAASCAFGLGVFGAMSFSRQGPNPGSQTEIRLLVTERERRCERIILSIADDSIPDEEGGWVLTNSPELVSARLESPFRVFRRSPFGARAPSDVISQIDYSSLGWARGPPHDC